MNAYEKFLRLLDFSEQELPEQVPLWKNACYLLGLTEEDVRFAAEEWIPTHWDLSLHGVRMCIGVYIRELIRMAQLPQLKAQGAKIIYSNVPCPAPCIYANKISGGDNLHICSPDNLMATVLNAFFHKSSVLSGYDSSCMNPMCHHCGMNRIRTDAQDTGIITEPTVLWSWGLYCNEAHKTDELIQAIRDGGWNYVLTTIPKDSAAGIAEAEDTHRVKYLAEQFKEGQRQISRYTGIEVTEAHVIAAAEEYIDYINKLENLTDMVSFADPQPISGNDLTIFGALTQVALDFGLKYLNEAMDVITEEVQQRIDAGVGPLPKGAPRLACQFVPFCVPWVNKTFFENGINLSTNTFFASASKQRKYFDRENIYYSLAQQWLCNPSAVNMQNEADLICENLEKYPLDGVLYGFFSFDRWIGSIQKTMIRIVEEKIGRPHYYLEGDFWNDERFTLEDRMDRIKGIAYKVKINHALRRWKNGQKQNT